MDAKAGSETRGPIMHWNTPRSIDWLKQACQSRWMAICLFGVIVLLYIGNHGRTSLAIGSETLKAAGMKTIQGNTAYWRLKVGANQQDLSSATSSPAIKKLQQLRERLRPLKVGALVFFGRRRYVKILNMYLERNLAKNGGILHEVMFAVKTKNQDDLDFLDQLVARHHGVYFRSDKGERASKEPMEFHKSYALALPGRIYVKIDDDVVFIQDGAIEAIVQEKLRGRYLFVSANVVNHPLLSHLHAKLGAILPFEPSRGLDPLQPFLLADNHKDSLDGSAAEKSEYSPFDNCFWKDWHCAAMAHYSFLHHMAHDNLRVYNYQLWDFNYPDYSRWSINFFAFNSSDLHGTWFNNETDDEMYISSILPRHKGKHCGAVGTNALVVHYAYYIQETELLSNTPGLLNDYARLAEEYTNGSLLDSPAEESLKGMFGLILPDKRIVPLDDQLEIVHKTARQYFDKDFKGVDEG